jgi:hypothetical protein
MSFPDPAELTKPARRCAILFALLLAVGVIAGCGGGSSASADAAAAGGGSSSSPSSGGESSAETAVKAEDPVSEGEEGTTIESAREPLTADNDEIQPTGAKVIKPCTLVTRPEAEVILGKHVTSAERPQGPTCVYSASGRTVTLAVEVNSVNQLRKAARRASKVNVNGRTGWCITYQATAVIIGVSGGRVLRADGPCQAGVRFVAKALPRV